MRLVLVKKWGTSKVGTELDPPQWLADKLVQGGIARAAQSQPEPAAPECAMAEPATERAVKPRAKSRSKKNASDPIQPVPLDSGNS